MPLDADLGVPHRAPEGSDLRMGPQVQQVLVVVSDPAFRVGAASALAAEGIAVTHLEDPEQTLVAVAEHRPDLVLLDVARAEWTGLALCTGLRERGVPVITVGDRSQQRDVVAWYTAGADAHVYATVGGRELVARVRAILRRPPARPAEVGAAPLVVGPISLDPATRRVTVGGVELAMPRREAEILEILLGSAGRIVPRDVVMRQLWGSTRHTKTLDVHLRCLRAKLEEVEGGRRIVTVRGVGFRLEPTLVEPIYAVEPSEAAEAVEAVDA